MRSRLVLLAFVLLLAGCGNNEAAPERPVSADGRFTTLTTWVRPSTSSPASATGGGNTAEVCREFFAITAQSTMTDEQSALAYGRLATRATDPGLSSALQRIADGFSRNEDSIPTDAVLVHC